MENNKQLLDQVKILIQVGDMTYLEKILSKNKVTSPSDYLKLLNILKSKEDFNLAHQICKNGSLETLKFFQSKSPKEPQLSLDFVDSNGQNCFHYSVARNHQDFVKYLIHEHKPKLNINQQTSETGESPLFFALGKLKNQPSEKVKMAKILMEADGIDIGLVNNEKKTCYEAYNDQFGYDEAANLIEKRHLKGTSNEEIGLSKLFFKDFTLAQRDQILDKKVTDQDKARIIEQHIFEQTNDVSFDQEIRNQLKQATALQERLKMMQTQTLYDPIKYLDQDHLRKSLQKRLLEFTGTSLIQNIKRMYNN